MTRLKGDPCIWMDRQKFSTEYKKAVQDFIKYQIHTLINCLATTGEESFLVSASLAENVASSCGSARGQAFLNNKALSLFKEQFLDFCKETVAVHSTMTSHIPTSSVDLGTEEDEASSSISSYHQKYLSQEVPAVDTVPAVSLSPVVQGKPKLTARQQERLRNREIMESQGDGASGKPETKRQRNREDMEPQSEGSSEMSNKMKGSSKDMPRGSRVSLHIQQIKINSHAKASGLNPVPGNVSSKGISSNTNSLQFPSLTRVGNDQNNEENNLGRDFHETVIKVEPLDVVDGRGDDSSASGPMPLSMTQTTLQDVDAPEQMEFKVELREEEEDDSDGVAQSDWQGNIQSGMDDERGMVQEGSSTTDGSSFVSVGQTVMSHSNTAFPPLQRMYLHRKKVNDTTKQSGMRHLDVGYIVSQNPALEFSESDSNSQQFENVDSSNNENFGIVLKKSVVTYRKAGTLSKKRKRIYPAAKLHKCKYCDWSYSRPSELKIHMRRHTGEKPFVCTICGKGFVASSPYYRHMRGHNKTYDHKCSHCEKLFSDVTEMRKHLFSVHGVTPFYCEICNTGYGHKRDSKRCFNSHLPKTNTDDNTTNDSA